MPRSGHTRSPGAPGEEEFLLPQEPGIEGKGGGGTPSHLPQTTRLKGSKCGNRLDTCLCPFSERAGRGSQAWREAIVQMGKLRHRKGKKKCPGGTEGRRTQSHHTLGLQAVGRCRALGKKPLQPTQGRESGFWSQLVGSRSPEGWERRVLPFLSSFLLLYRGWYTFPPIGTLRGLSKGSLEGSSWNAPLIPRPPTQNHNRQTHWHRAPHMPPMLGSEL